VVCTASFVNRLLGDHPDIQTLNDFVGDVARAFAAAGFPVVEKPAGLTRIDGNRPGGRTRMSMSMSIIDLYSTES